MEEGRQNHALIEQAIRRSILNEDRPGSPVEIEAELRALLQTDFPKASEKVLEAFLETWEKIPVPVNDERAELERRFYVNEVGDPFDGNSRDAFFGGVIDYAVIGPDRLAVWDWKTGWGMPEKDEEDQAICYAGSAVIRARLEGLNPQTVEACIFRPLRPWTSQVLTLDADEAVMRYHAILLECEGYGDLFQQLDDPEATTGDHCTRCPVRGSCMDYKMLAARVEFGDPAEAWATWRAVKEREKALSEYLDLAIEKNGPFALPDGRVVQHTRTEKWKLPAGLLWPMLRDRGVSAEDFMGIIDVSPTALKKLKIIKKDRELLEVLKSNCGTCSVSTKKEALTPGRSGDDTDEE